MRFWMVLLALAVVSAPRPAEARPRMGKWLRKQPFGLYSIGGFRRGDSDFSTTNNTNYNAKELSAGAMWKPLTFSYFAFEVGAAAHVQAFEVSEAKQRLNSLYGYLFCPEATLQFFPGSEWHPYFRADYILWGRKLGRGSKGDEKLSAEFSSRGASLSFGYEFRLDFLKPASLLVEYDVRAETVEPEKVKLGSRDVTDFYAPADYDSSGYRAGAQFNF